MFATFRSAILAGMAIALGGAVYLSVGGAVGALLFSFGLMTVILMKFRLYTGAVGFCMDRRQWLELPAIIAGNIVGCLLVALIMASARPELSAAAAPIVERHMAYDPLAALGLSALCGLVMTICCYCGRLQPGRQLIVTIAGVALFILAGLIHSIADAYYLCMMPLEWWRTAWPDVIPFYLLIVAGNALGGNLIRLINWRLDYA